MASARFPEASHASSRGWRRGPGLAPALVSGHSLRAGLATSAALAGHSNRAIMAQGQWKSRTMVDGYVRTADAWLL